MPCADKRARQLLERDRAVIDKMALFTIRLKDRTADASAFQPLRVKFDPGSKTTGIAIVLTGAKGEKIFFGEISTKRTSRLAWRFGERSTEGGGIGRPAIASPDLKIASGKRGVATELGKRVGRLGHAFAKLRNSVPITAISVEHVKFDTQKMLNAEISGVEYQQGTRLGDEVREYLREKWGRQCVYCGVTHVPLEVEHIIPKRRGGSNRISNLTLACEPCNRKKNPRTAAEFGFPQVQAQAQKSLPDAAMMNTTRWRLYHQLQATGLPVEGGSGARTKMQRIQHGLPKEHYYDALSVGASTPNAFTRLPVSVQVWAVKGRGTRQMCGTDQYGFPIRHRLRQKVHWGFQTGDLVRARVPKGKYAGTHMGRVLVRARGSFDLSAQGRRVAQGISYKYCRIVQRDGGWTYAQRPVSA